MDYLAKYTIPYKGLQDGSHEFEFTADEKFFEHFQFENDFQGQVSVKATLLKKTLVMTLNIEIGGDINVTCDRCLDRFPYHAKGESTLFIKFGETYEELDNDIIVVPESDYEITIAQYIYELILLSFPINFIHPDDEDGFSTCNEEMIQKLDEHSETEKIDPRWSELKKLIDNK
ncbi:YceD family protein [Ancylomarina sp. YFZ004]